MTKVRRLLRIERKVSSLNLLVSFYCDALGFERIRTENNTAQLKLGAQEVWLTETGRRSYPTDSHSNDLWFQHFAIVTTDMVAAYTRLNHYPHTAITQNGPQKLPPATGSVTAYKFRDPDGHPLELIYFPHGDHPIGIDHSAISVADADRSIDFYRDQLGFTLANRQTNHGLEQDRLDNLSGTHVDVIALEPIGQSTPHLELLAYQSPKGRAGSKKMQPIDIGADRLVWAVDDLVAILTRLDIEKISTDTVLLRDPDGHLLVLRAVG